MDAIVQQKLSELNREFYSKFAPSFAVTRSEPQPGFYGLEGYLPESCEKLLDVGCGEGRLGRFLLSREKVSIYHGVDATLELIDLARKGTGGTFWQRDLAQPDALRGLGSYDCIACLAVLQHIPGSDNRVRLLAEMGAHLAIGGRLLLSTWQFLTSERQRKKIVDWSEAGLSQDELEQNDYLLTWSKGGRGLRYVCFIDETELASIATQAGLQIVATFRSDGREGNLNLYSVMSANVGASKAKLT